jgi:hypothetical protein
MAVPKPAPACKSRTDEDGNPIGSFLAWVPQWCSAFWLQHRPNFSGNQSAARNRNLFGNVITDYRDRLVEAISQPASR